MRKLFPVVVAGILAIVLSSGAFCAQSIDDTTKQLLEEREKNEELVQQWIYTAKREDRNENPTEAMKYYRMAADRGDSYAQLCVGMLYEWGRGVKKDDIEAARWYRKAAEQGMTPAQGRLGVLYSIGHGVQKDEVEAFKWLRMAADAETVDTDVHFFLGIAYSMGTVVHKNDVEAVKFWRKAAQKGHALSQGLLGNAYFEGNGVQRDFGEAYRWRHMAAYSGPDIPPVFWVSLGYMHYEGRGTPQNYVEAMKCYMQAAEQGLTTAQFNVGLMYALGRGVQQDFVKAYMWSSLAATQGDLKATKNRDFAASKLTPAQLAKAQKLASEWRPRAAKVVLP